MLDLPSELVLSIFRELDHESLLALSTVSRATKAIIQNDGHLQLIIALAKTGMQDAMLPLTPREKAQRLRDLHARWRSLQWGTFSEWRDLEDNCRAYELVDGLFAHLSDRGKLLILQLPSLAGSPMEVLCHESLRWRVADFVLDPTQDIIVFLIIEDEFVDSGVNRILALRVCSLSNRDRVLIELRFGVPVATIFNDESVNGSSMQLNGEHIAIFIGAPADASRLIIWNWRSGNVVADSCSFPGCKANQSSSFAFVDEETYYLTSLAGSGSIELYRFDQSTPPKHFTSLQFPPISAEGALVSKLYAHCEAPLGRQSKNSFSSAAGRKLHSFRISYLTMDAGRPETPDYMLYVPTSTLCAPHSGTVPWAEWGPHGTRFLASHSSHHWLRYVHGMRVIVSPYTGAFQVLDFNVDLGSPQPVPKDSDPEVMTRLGSSPTVFPPNEVFAEEVQSHLPYVPTSIVSSARHEDLFCGAWMIDQERIVGLKVGGDHGERILKLVILCM